MLYLFVHVIWVTEFWLILFSIFCAPLYLRISIQCWDFVFHLSFLFPSHWWFYSLPSFFSINVDLFFDTLNVLSWNSTITSQIQFLPSFQPTPSIYVCLFHQRYSFFFSHIFFSAHFFFPIIIPNSVFIQLNNHSTLYNYRPHAHTLKKSYLSSSELIVPNTGYLLAHKLFSCPFYVSCCYSKFDVTTCIQIVSKNSLSLSCRIIVDRHH